MSEQTQSPYKILQKFVIWEIMDLEAMIEAINQKDEILKAQNQMLKSYSAHQKELQSFRTG
jgi:hypothetical protein